MRQPRLHLFVCANRREGSPLGPGCGERGDDLYAALKVEVSARHLVNEVWVTKTQCLGICPKVGATVARYPSKEPIRADMEPAHVAALLAPEQVDGAADGWSEVERELGALEELQGRKVLDLARRLKPGLTLEDVQNPHDFPELDDSDWHHADGILTGMKSVTTALRALRRRLGGV
jgi:(2Fe-2S) ferredoxin